MDRENNEHSQPSISIIVAAYNESENVIAVMKAVRKMMPDAEIVVVDDGSSDDTAVRARSFHDNNVKVVVSDRNYGKGHAIRTGVDAASGELMGQIDADLQFPAEGLPSLFQPLLEGKTDIVFGSRYLKGSQIDPRSVSFMKRLASHVMGLMVTVMTGQRYTDVFAGFKAWRADVIRDIDLQQHDFTYEAEIAIKARKLGYRVIEIPTGYCLRTAGNSNIKLLYHTVTIGWKVICMAVSPVRRNTPVTQGKRCT